nr:hypothetical protein [Candidatus Sigynarchaeota archaeon]
MAELLLLHGLFELIAGKKKMNLKQLYEKLSNPVLEPYQGDFSSFKEIFFRLNQEGVLKSRIVGDELIIDSYSSDSYIHKEIKKLQDLCHACKDAEEFENKLHTSALNKYFMDAEEIKAVFFFFETSKSSKPARAPASTPVEAPASEKASFSPKKDIATKSRVDEMKGIFEQKLDKLKKMAKDYFESLLSKENEMDLVVLRYLLNDLLPLRDLKLNTDTLMLEAIKERNMPFVLEGTIYKRIGPRIKKSGPEVDLKERSMLQTFALILSRSLMDSRSVPIHDLELVLKKEGFSIPEGETLESLIEKAIKQGFFKGYMDLVEQKLFRAKTEKEQYQEQFMKELNALSREIADDAEKLKKFKAGESKIPDGLEALLMSPEKPKDICGVLDKAESLEAKIQELLLDTIQVGRKVSITDLSKQLKERVHKEQVDVPWTIDNDAVEKLLEKLVDSRKITGYFEDSMHFFRKR